MTLHTLNHSLPQNHRVYAIGDIHGWLDPLQRLVDQIKQDIKDNPISKIEIVFLGDYVDRGPNCKEVIEYLIDLPSKMPDIKITYLQGNHDMNVEQVLVGDQEEVKYTWITLYGGADTFNSYGINIPDERSFTDNFQTLSEEARTKVPNHHIDFFRNLNLYYHVGQFLFVHAGIRPGKALKYQVMRDLMFIREPFLSATDMDYPFCVVHGHTICQEPEILPHRICVDTSYYQNKNLTAAVIENNTARFLQVNDSGR